jgi:hypothetical protein
MEPMRFIYLHGFASSPASRKAGLFEEKLAVQGIPVEALDLAPDFQHLTITGQLTVMESAIHGDPVVLIGSSLGGYLAALYAARHPEVDRLVLLAPAFDFYQLWVQELGPQRLEEWRKNGFISVFHYRIGREAPLNYQVMEDSKQFQAFPDFPQPCLILHGLMDKVVPFEKSARFAATHANVTLIPFDSGHELTDVLDEIWKTSSTFLLSANTKSG